MALNVGELYASFGIDSKGLDKQISGIEKQCQSIGKGLTVAGAGMTAALTAPLLKMGKSMYKAGTDFEAQMSRVEAISGASGQALADLTSKALEMGSTTKFTATEAGQALEYMAMAGWKDESMLAGLEPIMNLAAASGEDLSHTSDIVTDAMTAFGYTLDSVGGDTEAFNAQITHFSDVLAAASTNANTNVAMMGESFKYVAPLAGTLGYSVDDIAVALGTMANAGIKGSQAGTSLQRMIQNMISPTKKQSAAMKKLGLSLYDSNGKTKSFSEVMGDMRKVAKESGIDMKELQTKVSELDTQLANGEITQKQYDKAVKKLTKGNAGFLEAVSDLAGARGLAGMLAIMNASDEDFDALTESILHCDGATAKMAQTMLDNAQGKVTIFKSAMEGLGITLWTHVAPAFTEIVEKATDLVDGFRKMDSRTQKAVLKMAGLAAAAGPAAIAMGALVSAVPKLVPALSALISPLGIVIGALGLFAVAAVDTNNDIGRTFATMSIKASIALNKFNGSILGTMRTISKRMPRLISTIVVGLRHIVPAVTEGIGLALTGFMEVVRDNAGGILNIGLTIIEGIVQGITKNMKLMIPTAAEMLVELGSALIGAIPRLVSAIGSVGLSIAEALLTVDWFGLGGKLLDSIVDSVQKSTEKGTEIVDSLIGLINENLTPENLSAKLTNATAFASKLFTALTSVFTTVGDTGVNVVDKIVEAINNVLGTVTGEEFTSKLGGLAEAIINGIVSSLTSLGVAGSKILTSIITGITTVLGNIGADSFGNLTDLANTIMTAIGNGISNLHTTSKTIITSVGSAIGGLLSQVTSSQFGDGITTLATALVTGLADNIITLIDSVGDIGVTIAESIGTLLGSIGESSFTNLGGFAKTLIECIGKAIGAALSSAGAIVDAIAKLLGDALGANSGVNLGKNLGDLGASVIGAIANAIESAAGGAASLITAVGNLISTALSSGSIGDLSEFGGAIISALVEAVKKVGNAAGQILGAIGTALSNISWDEVGADLASLASGLLASLVQALTGGETDFSSVMKAIGTGLGSVVYELAEAGKAIALGLIGFILDPATWSLLVQGIVGILEGLFTGIGAFLDELTGGSLVEDTEEKIEHLANATDSVTEFSEAAESVRESGEAFDETGQSLSDLEHQAAEASARILQSMMTLTDANLSDVSSGIEEALNVLTNGGTAEEIEAATAALEQYQTLLQNMAASGVQDSMYITGDNIMSNIVAGIHIDGYTFDDSTESSYDEAYSALQELIGNALENKPVPVVVPIEVEPGEPEESDGPSETDLVDTVMGSYTEKLEELGVSVPVQPDVEVTVGEVTSGEDTGMQEATQEVIDAMIAAQSFTATVDVATTINVNVSESNSDAIGSELGNGLATAFSTAISNATGAVSTAAAGLKTAALNGLVGGSGKAYTMGQNFAKGFMNGINSKISEIADKAAEMVREAIRAANAAQDSGSPSRVMAKVGGWYGQGYINGIMGKIHAVQRAAGGMAEAAVNGLTMRSTATPALAIAGGANARESIDYNRLAYAMSQQPAPVLSMDGKDVARINSDNTATAQNARSRNIALRYGAR